MNVIPIHRNKYVDKYKSLGKFELLEEMVRFQEERSRQGRLTPDMSARGIALFTELRNQAETEELRTLTNSYIRYLETYEDNESILP